MRVKLTVKVETDGRVGLSQVVPRRDFVFARVLHCDTSEEERAVDRVSILVLQHHLQTERIGGNIE